MKKTAWPILTSALVFVVITVGIFAYLAHDLPFEQRVDCATGEGYGFLPPACRAYISAITMYDAAGERERMSASLHRLMTAYNLNSKNVVGARALKLADRFIELGADVNFVDQQGGTPLHTAVLHGDLRLVRFLLERGADANKRTRVQFLRMTLSPLELARNIKQKGNDGLKWAKIINLLEM